MHAMAQTTLGRLPAVADKRQRTLPAQRRWRGHRPGAAMPQGDMQRSQEEQALPTPVTACPVMRALPPFTARPWWRELHFTANTTEVQHEILQVHDGR